MRAPIAVVLFLTVAPSLVAAPRIAFDRVLPAPQSLGAAEDLAIVHAIGDTTMVETFIDRLIDQVNRGTLRIRDARGQDLRGARTDALISIRAFTCQSRNQSIGGRQYVDATCMARVDTTVDKQRLSFPVRGDGTSPRVDEITEDVRELALEYAARHAAENAAAAITPRRVRESIPLDETAPAFEEGYVHITAQQFAEAREVWNRALRKDPRSAALHYNLAALAEALGDRKAAEQHYVAARKLAPSEVRYAGEYKLFVRRGGRF